LSPIKKAKGKKGSVAIVAGTKTEQVIEHVSKIDSIKDIYRNHIRYNSMKLIAKNVSKAIQ
jgi:hypothetical protein